MDAVKESDGDKSLKKLLSVTGNGSNGDSANNTTIDNKKNESILKGILNKKDAMTQEQPTKKNDGAVDDDDDDDDDNDEDKKINSTEDADELLLIALKYKEDGNAFFQSGDYDKAGRSYRRGCSAIRKNNENNSGDVQVKALLLNLRTNMSMVCMKQKKYKQSRDIASQALAVDCTHVKALYRRALAHRKMGDVDAARDDLKNALTHDPDNRQVRKELLMIKHELETLKEKEKKALQAAFSNNKGGSFLYQDKEEENKKKVLEKQAKKQRAKEALEGRKKKWEDECVHKLANNEEAISFDEWTKLRLKKEKEEKEEIKKKKELERKQQTSNINNNKRNSISSNNYPDDSSDSEIDEKELASLRGYKTTSDGKTTSYFNRELSHMEKALIGDNAPKQILTPNSSNTSQSSSTTTQSAWNTAQTWEERDTTDWCITSLVQHLQSTTIPSQSQQDYIIKVTKVEPITGHSSFALSSGRKRYIFDFSATVVFNITSITSTDIVLASGSFLLPEISSVVIDHQYDVELKWNVEPNSDDLCMKSICKNEFPTVLKESVKAFVLDFNSNF